MFKKILSLLFLSLLLPFISSAQTGEVTPLTQEFRQPQVYILDLSLDKTELKIGETVKGSFTLLNDGDVTESDIYYKVSLDGEYVDGLSRYTYDSLMNGPVFLKAKESKKISFSYKVPDSFLNGDNLGIKVRILTRSGAPLSFADVLIKVTGGSGFASIEKAEVIIGNESFDITAGPTIKEGEKVLLSYALKNASKGELSFTPVASISDLSKPDVVSQQVSGAVISLKSGETKTFSLELPNFDYKPGVYFGSVDFVSGTSKKAPTLPFRYIVGGNIVTIHSVTANVSAVKVGDQFSTTVSFSGQPFDIRLEDLGTSSSTQKYTLAIKITNEKGQVVSEYKGLQDLSMVSAKTFNLIANQPAKALAASVEVWDGEKMITDYKTEISRLEDAGLAFSYSDALIMAALIILILAVVIIVLGGRSKSKPLIITGTVMLVVSVVLLGFWFKNSLTQKAEAFSTTSYWSSDPDRRSMSISVNNISDKTPGQSFSVNGSVSFWACSNGVQSILGDVNNNGGNSRVLSGSDVRSTTYYTGYVDFNFNNFTAPSTAGDYKINFVDVKVCPHPGQSCAAHPVIRISGYQPYRVVAPVVNGACGSASGTSAVSAPTTNLCSAGTASAVSSSTSSWTWTCAGTGSGSTASCAALKSSGSTGGGTGTGSSTGSGGGTGSGTSGTCSDNIQNQDEIGVDIGGVCSTYPAGTGSCFDGIRNGNETAIDVGGRCGTGILDCQPVMTSPAGNPVSVEVNNNTTWSVTPIYNGYTRAWKVSNNGGISFIDEAGSSNVLNKIFTTVGQKTVSVSLATTTWVSCATEGGTCSFSGTKSVKYGANSSFNYRTLTNGTVCNNQVFGDPLPGVRKYCYISDLVYKPCDVNATTTIIQRGGVIREI